MIGQSETTAEASDVRVHGKARQAECHAAYNIRCLPTDAGQRHEVLEGGRDLTIEPFLERDRHSDQALGLVLIEAGRADDLLDNGGICCGQFGGRWVGGEQCRGDNVHPRVRGLRRHDRRREQLERVAVVQLTERDRVHLSETPVDLSRSRLGGPRSSHERQG